MPRQRRPDKVQFLRTPYYEGSQITLPHKYKYSNIIDHNSLPVPFPNNKPRPKPDPDVYDFPASYWPSPDTPLIPEDMSAAELWQQCCRNATANLSRTNGRQDNRRRENKSNSSTSRRPHKDKAPKCIPIPNNQILGAVQDIERLPKKDQEDRLLFFKTIFSDEDYVIVEQVVEDKRNEYMREFEKSYTERGVGPMPKSDNSAYLARELKRRVGCQESGLDWKKSPVIRRKQHLPAKHELNVPRKTEEESAS